MPLKLHKIYAAALLALLAGLPAFLPAQPAQAAPATESEARQVLAVYIKEKTIFLAKISAELEAAGFTRGKSYGDREQLERASQYCWLVSKNPKRLAEARKNLLDTERMPDDRMKTLGLQHAEFIAGVLRINYPPAEQRRGNQGGAGEEPGAGQELWKTAAARALAEREVSSFLDRLFPLIPKEWHGTYSSGPAFAALLLPYAEDQAVMQAVPAILSSPVGQRNIVSDLLEKRELNPDGFRNTLLRYADQALFSSSYAVLRTEGVTLPLATTNPGLARQLTSLGNAELPGRPESIGPHPLGLDEGERANGLIVEKVEGEALNELIKTLEAGHCAFMMENSSLAAFLGIQEGLPYRGKSFPLHANIAQMHIRPLESLKESRASEALRHSGKFTDHGLKDARLIFTVPGRDVEKAGRDLAENLSWLSIVYSGREAFLRGKADLIADLINPYDREARAMVESSALPTDEDVRCLRYARPWSLPFFITLAERASPEQLRELFGPAGKVLITLGEERSCYVLSIKGQEGGAGPSRLGVEPPLALPADFLQTLSQREINLMHRLVESYYATQGVAPELYQGWMQKTEALCEENAIASLGQRCSLQIMMVGAVRLRRGEEFFNMMQEALADKNGRIVDKIERLFTLLP